MRDIQLQESSFWTPSRRRLLCDVQTKSEHCCYMRESRKGSSLAVRTCSRLQTRDIPAKHHCVFYYSKKKRKKKEKKKRKRKITQNKVNFGTFYFKSHIIFVMMSGKKKKIISKRMTRIYFSFLTGGGVF
ncbi:hypothetical protein AOLI_G00025860 [Acnodon oligacanthus]